MDEIKSSLKKSKVFTILLVAQLTISFFIINLVFHNINSMKDSNDNLNNSFKSVNYYQMIDSFESQEQEDLYWSDKNNLTNLKKFYNLISESDYYSYLEMIFQPIEIIDFQGIDKMYSAYGHIVDITKTNFIIDNKTYSTIKNIMVNKETLENFKINIAYGRTFNNSEFYWENIESKVPIILGSNYEGIYSIGDIIKGNYYQMEVTFEVIGIMDEAAAIIREGNIISLEDYILSPMFNIDDESVDYNFQRILYLMKSNGTIVVQSENDFNRFLVRLDNLKSQYNVFDINIIGMSTISVHLLKLASQESIYLMVSLSIILSIFNIISISSIFTCKFIKNKRDYGIYLLCGAKKRDIIKYLILEAFILVIVSHIIAALLTTIFSINFIKYSFTWVLISMIPLLLGCIKPTISIYKNNINSMIKGD